MLFILNEDDIETNAEETVERKEKKELKKQMRRVTVKKNKLQHMQSYLHA